MRERIVINLDAQKTEGAKPVRKRRRWRRVLVILGLLVVAGAGVAVIEGFLLLRQFRSSPTYALASILDAAQHNDVAEFQKRIDAEEITKNMAASINQKAAGTMPSLLPGVKQAVHDELFNVMKAFAAAPEEQSFITLVGVVRKLMTVTTEGDSAKVTGKMAGHNIEMLMRRDADGWKITDVKDELIVQRIVDGVMKDLPPITNIDWSKILPKKSQRKRSGRGR